MLWYTLCEVGGDEVKRDEMQWNFPGHVPKFGAEGEKASTATDGEKVAAGIAMV